MSIDAIFTRYEVAHELQQQALVRGASVCVLEGVWVGTEVTWPLLVKACIFADLGATSAHIRKKIGLDKYTTTLITRGRYTFAELVAESSDIHQVLYAFVMWQCTGVVREVPHRTWERIVERVNENLTQSISIPAALTPRTEYVLRAIDILHYKNPSV